MLVSVKEGRRSRSSAREPTLTPLSRAPARGEDPGRARNARRPTRQQRSTICEALDDARKNRGSTPVTFMLAGERVVTLRTPCYESFTHILTTPGSRSRPWSPQDHHRRSHACV